MIQVFKKPIQVNGKEKTGIYYYASFSRKGTASSIELAAEMKEASSAFTEGEVVGVTLDLPKRIKAALLSGMAVTINGLGTFKPSLSVDEVKENPDDLRTSAIRIKSINFKPDAALLTDLNMKAKFEWISQEKANEEDADDDGTGDGTEGTGTGTDGAAGTEDTGTDGAAGNDDNADEGGSF